MVYGRRGPETPGPQRPGFLISFGLFICFERLNIFVSFVLLDTPPMGDRLGVAVGLMGSEDPADSAF